MLRYIASIMAVVCFLAFGCKGPPSTGDRAINQTGEQGTLKVCLERAPAFYNAEVDSRLKAALPLEGKTEAQAEASIQAYLHQEAGGTKRGQDLQDYMNHICLMANNGNWSEATTERLLVLGISKFGGEEAGTGPSPRESSEIRFAKSCMQPTDGLRRQPEFFVPIWLDFLRLLSKQKFPPDRDLLNLYSIKGRYRDPYNAPEDFFSESLYTLKCLEDVGEVKLEKLGTTATYGGKAFDNQRIVFRSP